MSNKPAVTIWRDALAAVRTNRRALRRRGLSGEDVSFLELWLAMPRASLAALGRIRGYTRQAARSRVVRLETAGAVVRLHGRMLPNVRGLLRWSAEGVRQRLALAAERVRKARADALALRNSLKAWRDSGNDNGALSHKGTKGLETGEAARCPALRGGARVDEAVEARWLVAMGLL